MTDPSFDNSRSSDSKAMRREQLEAYLDGRLDPAERKAFERSLRHDSETRAALETQQRLDRSLQRSFAPPPVVPLPPWPTEPAPPTPTPVEAVAGRSLLGRLAAAAALLISVAVLGVGIRSTFPGLRGQSEPEIVSSLAEVYEQSAQDEFTPNVTLSDLDHGAAVLTGYFNQPLNSDDLPDNAQLLGLSYCRALSRCSLCILVRVDDDVIILAADHVRHARSSELNRNGDRDINVFERRFNSMVLYELTPRSAPCLLDVFAQPE